MDRVAPDRHRPVGAEWRCLGSKARSHLVDDDRVLIPVVLGIGEHIRQELLAAELIEAPPERVNSAGAA